MTSRSAVENATSRPLVLALDCQMWHFLRRSDRLRGLPPEFGLYNPGSRTKTKSDMPEEAKPVLVSTQQQVRNPSTFKGNTGQDPNKWIKEYERVAAFNHWDDTVSLANVFFFLDGTARQWFENHEDKITSWDMFKSELKQVFGDAQHYVRKAEEELKSRAQKSGESTQSYIQSVLGLCQQVKPGMAEEEKISHLMKGIAEDIYQALLTKRIMTTGDFADWCRRIEEMQQKRVRRINFDRLPNVVPMAAMEEQPDLVSLIRRIVREEVQRLTIPTEDPIPQIQSIEDIVREEVENVLAPVSKAPYGWTDIRRKQRPTYAAVARRVEPVRTESKRKTDVWRTTDNRPVCFHCGRPGHVVRYCRERKAVFDAYRNDRRDDISSQSTQKAYRNDYSRPTTRTSSQSPSRGRSPNRRYRSPSPYRRSSQSPSQRNEEN